MSSTLDSVLAESQGSSNNKEREKALFSLISAALPKISARNYIERAFSVLCKKMALINLYKYDKAACAKHLVAMEGVSVCYNETAIKARNKQARKLSIYVDEVV